jgi:hypothetical protein
VYENPELKCPLVFVRIGNSSEFTVLADGRLCSLGSAGMLLKYYNVRKQLDISGKGRAVQCAAGVCVCVCVVKEGIGGQLECW